jgi:AAA+ superfamily predicted ATPase
MPQQLKAASEPHPPSNSQKPSFKRLAGYEDTLEQVRTLGFISAGDTKFRKFAEQTAAFHGIERMVLFDSYIICGSSRDDVNLFAETTAVELGSPILMMQVEIDKTGNGSIRMSGPFRRSPFGSPDLSDIPVPCTLLINGIDQLQRMIDRENRELALGHIQHQGRMIQHEILGMLSGIIQRGDVYVVATSCDLKPLVEPLASLFGQCATIEVKPPTLMERFEVLECFADDHPSFRELDLRHLAHLSAGASRHEIVGACRQSLESAYRKSLKHSRQCLVDYEELLVNLNAIAGKNSRHREDLEDEAIALFRCDIENVERELGEV